MVAFKANRTADMRRLDVFGSFDDGAYYKLGETNFRVAANGLVFDVLGSAFTYGGDAVPDTGVIDTVNIHDAFQLPNQPPVPTLLHFKIEDLDLTVREAAALAGLSPGAAASRIFSGSDNINGSSGNDFLNGYGGADILRGGTGNDVMVVDNRADRVYELDGQGTDTIQASITFKLNDRQSVEQLKLIGAADINGTGNVFDNVVTGNGGDNRLSGGAGSDTLTGLGGADSFVFDTAMQGDRIRDFSAEDRILLDHDIFQDVPLGRLAASAFKDIGEPGARVDASDRILYDSDNGALYWDFNGNTPGGRTFVARFLNQADLDHTDFFVVA